MHSEFNPMSSFNSLSYNRILLLMAHLDPPRKRRLLGIKCVAEILNEIMLVRVLVQRLEAISMKCSDSDISLGGPA